MSRHLSILISKSRGNQDYIKSIAMQIRDCVQIAAGALSCTVYLETEAADNIAGFCQLDDVPESSSELNDFAAQARLVTQADMAAAAHMAPTHRIIAAGRGMLSAAIALQQALDTTAPGRTRISYITHASKRDDYDHLRAAGIENAEIISPQTWEAVQAEFGDAAAIARQIEVPGVPNSYTLENCLHDLTVFHRLATQTPGDYPGQVIEALETGRPVALVVVPAGGNDPLDGEQDPYTEAEAAAFGQALAHLVPPDATLLLTEGGPRNRNDRTAGQDALAALRDAYRHERLHGMTLPDGQVPHAAVLAERFTGDCPYDGTKIFLAFAVTRPAQICHLFVGAEAYGLRDAALRLVDLTELPVTMIDSASLRRRGDDVSGDRKAGLGFASLDADGNMAVEIVRHHVPLAPRPDPVKALWQVLQIG